VIDRHDDPVARMSDPAPQPERPSARGGILTATLTTTLVRVGAAIACLAVGATVRFVGHDLPTADAIWRWGLGLLGSVVVLRTARGLVRGRFAADIVASFAIVVAFALDQSFAGLVIVVMQTGGEALEVVAEGRASRALRDLEKAAPRWAHRLRDDAVTDVTVDAIVVGDLLLVRPGEMIPCDGTVTAGHSHVDASTLTGEPVPMSARPEVPLMSGALNLESPLTLRATALAAESQYHRIVELVRSAQASKAPLQRLADRYAVWFTPITIAICIVTYLVTGDPVRVLAVLVVATPCPLILATPIAIVAGINQMAKRHVVIRRGGALEQMGHLTTVVFDKTGTLTLGKPQVANVTPATGRDANDVLRLAAAVEHGSGHLLARTLVEAAVRAGLASLPAVNVVETPGSGVTGLVEGHMVRVGALGFVIAAHPETSTEFMRLSGGGSGLRAYVAIDGHAAAVIEYADRPRAGMPRFLDRLRQAGAQRILLLSGDAQENVDEIATAVGIDEARGDLLPEDKVAAIEALMRNGEHVIMLGDGTNDAPALSAATVGVALSVGGSGITAEAADAVILGDDPSRLADAIEISRRTMRIARQSIWGGLVCSGIAIGFAMFGLIPPAIGAIVQEAVDVAVIVNALRVAR
jgi:heavy metal translocating P-type ATPase